MGAAIFPGNGKALAVQHAPCKRSAIFANPAGTPADLCAP
jgi:hypothetical protein